MNVTIPVTKYQKQILENMMKWRCDPNAHDCDLYLFHESNITNSLCKQNYKKSTVTDDTLIHTCQCYNKQEDHITKYMSINILNTQLQKGTVATVHKE